jgi:hypothetical protein
MMCVPVIDRPQFTVEWVMKRSSWQGGTKVRMWRFETKREAPSMKGRVQPETEAKGDKNGLKGVLGGPRGGAV